MASARFAWGIDVGNRALKAVKLIRDGEQLKVDDFEIIEHEQVLSNAGDNRESLIQTALAHFVQRHQTKGGVVGIGVSGQSSFARFIKLPPVEPKKIPEIVRFEAIQQIPFPLDDVEWSYQLFQSAESPDVEVGIFAMRKELINRHIRYFTDIDLNVQVVQMNPLAVYNAMQRDGRFSETTMVIDMGAENTDLIIADNETVWLRSIPIGGNNFTESLVKSFKLNFAKAEELKRTSAASKYARQIFQAMRPVFADLAAEVQRSIGFYASVHRDSRIRKIIALGGTFRLPGLQKYLEQNLQLDIERLNGLGAGAPSDSKLATTFNENLLSMISAYGLALQAMGEGKISSSLLPQHIRRAKLWKEKTKWFASAAALFVAGTAIPYGSLYMHSGALEQAMRTHESTINQTKSRAEQLSNEWSEMESSGGNDRQRIINIRSLEDYRTLWPLLIKDIHDAVPQETTAALDVTKLKQTPRNARNMILIDSIRSAYHEDLNPFLASGRFSEAVAADTPLSLASFEGAAPAFADVTAGSAGGGPPMGRMPPVMGGGGPGMMPPVYGGMGGGPGGMPPVFGGPMGAMGGAPAAADSVPAGPAQRGFLITVRCTTPNRDGYRLVDSTLLKKLLALSPGNIGNRPYAIVKGEIVLATQIKQDAARMEKLRGNHAAAHSPSGAGGGGMMGGGGMPPVFRGGMPPVMGRGGMPMGGVPMGGGSAEGAVEEPDPFLDPLTGEDVRDDWEFTVLLAVVLDPAAPAPPAPVENP